MTAQTSRRTLLLAACLTAVLVAPAAPAQEFGPRRELRPPILLREEPPPGVEAALDRLRDGIERARRGTGPWEQRTVALRDVVAGLPRPGRVLLLQREAERIVRAGGGPGLVRASVDSQAQLALISEELEFETVQREVLRAIERLLEPRPAAKPNWDDLRRGDLLFVHHEAQPVQSFLWAMRFSHCGNYDGDGWVYEAVLGQGVVRRRIEEWKAFEGTVALARDADAAAGPLGRAIDRAIGRYGCDGRTPYNLWFFDKETDERLYCSQLTWKIHRSVNVDLDSNDPRYLLWMRAKWGSWITDNVAVPAVAPDEVALSPHVRITSEGAVSGQ